MPKPAPTDNEYQALLAQSKLDQSEIELYKSELARYHYKLDYIYHNYETDMNTILEDTFNAWKIFEAHAEETRIHLESLEQIREMYHKNLSLVRSIVENAEEKIQHSKDDGQVLRRRK